MKLDSICKWLDDESGTCNQNDKECPYVVDMIKGIYGLSEYYKCPRDKEE